MKGNKTNNQIINLKNVPKYHTFNNFIESSFNLLWWVLDPKINSSIHYSDISLLLIGLKSFIEFLLICERTFLQFPFLKYLT